MKALVTGGAGFIGSHVVDALLARGHEVVVVDDLSTGRDANLRDAIEGGASLVVGDIRDADLVAELLGREEPDAVFHFAARIDVRQSVSNPRGDAEVNVAGTINLLEGARLAGARRFVHASTGGAIYGEGDAPFAEDAPIAPLSPYGQAKYAAEGYCDLYRRLHGLSTVNLRLANVYGPRQDPLGEGGVIAIFGGRLAAGERPLVYGDGGQTRDYVYVEDVVRASLATSENGAHGAYNVGTGREISVLELIERLADAGRELGLGDAAGFEPEFAAERMGEVRRSVLDPGKAASEFGFETRTAIDEGLRRTLESIGSESSEAGPPP